MEKERAGEIYELEPECNLVGCSCKCWRPAAQPCSVNGNTFESQEIRGQCICSTCQDVDRRETRCRRKSTFGNEYCNECRPFPLTEKKKKEADKFAAVEKQKEDDLAAAAQRIRRVQHEGLYWGSQQSPTPEDRVFSSA
jgi:hypothetical protein